MKSSVHIKRSAAFLSLGIALLGVSFMVVHGVKYGNLVIGGRQWQILGALALAWIAVTTLMKLPEQLQHATFGKGLDLLSRTSLIILFLLSMAVNALQFMHWSRLMVYGPGVVFWVLGVAAFAVYRWIVPPMGEAKPRASRRRRHSVSYMLAGVDLLVLTGSFLAMTVVKRRELAFYGPYDDLLVLGGGLWLIAALATRKFDHANFVSRHEAVFTAIRATGLFGGLLAFFLFALRLGPVSRVQVFGAVGLYLLVEIAVFALFANYRKYRGGGDIQDVTKARDFVRARQRDLSPTTQAAVCDPLREKLQHALEFMFPALYPFLDRHLDLDGIDRCHCTLLNSRDLFNLEALDPGRMRLIVNLHKLNDIRWFNRYFLLAHTRLQNGGFLVGMAHTVDTHRALYAARFPRPLDSLFYGLSFLWHRACPKLPWLQKIYFALTKGQNRMVSRAEVLGRLYFCGFEVVAETEIGHRFFFIARKDKTPSEDRNPTYGPLVRLTRHGLGGRPITVFKFRTMFPFSEYLQAYVYQCNNLCAGGKFKEDFRVTGWGRFMRRLWIDELPMLYNWLRGDLQLIGVRPLSRQYLALYDPDLQALRKRVKPGLLPPYYADMPSTLEEIMASERRYISAYLSRPTHTQYDYFRKCFWNIVVLQKRSA